MSLRRAYIRLREAAQDLHNQIRADFSPMKTSDIYDFSRAEDYDKFQVTTDRVLGGQTEAEFFRKDYKNFSSGMFQGIINHNDDNPLSNGGFASFRTLPDERVRDLSAFNALEMRIKTDGRPYIANFRCTDHGADQLWQIRLITEPMRWTTIAFPISDLMLTKRGRVDVFQLPINKETINSFGVLLADRRNGPFRFEIQYLRALRSFVPEHHAHVDQMMVEETLKKSQAMLDAQKSPEELKKEAALLAYKKQRQEAKVD